MLIASRITLNAPLTPFTVVFCNIIENYQEAQEDLKLLQNFVNAFQGSRQVSDGVDKFYQLCFVFWKVAETYVRAKSEEARLLQNANSMSTMYSNEASWQPAIGEFDEYLSALGFVPPNLTEQQDILQGASTTEAGPSMNLQDWYSGNASLYGLLEQDLSILGGYGNVGNQAW